MDNVGFLLLLFEQFWLVLYLESVSTPTPVFPSALTQDPVAVVFHVKVDNARFSSLLGGGVKLDCTMKPSQVENMSSMCYAPALRLRMGVLNNNSRDIRQKK